MDRGLYLRYLGVLGILCEIAVYLPDEEDRQTIEMALEDACKHHPLQWRRILNRFEISPTE